MKISFTPEATEALTRIGRYYFALNAFAAQSVEADLRATIERIRLQPLLYPSIGRDGTRRAVTRRYRHLIFFRVVDGESIDVVAIRHGAERPRPPAEDARPRR